MKLVIQRVTSASVSVDGKAISRIGRGVLVLLGIHRIDTIECVDNLARKLCNIRLWENEGKSWDHSVIDKKFEILIVSQFTLYGYAKGNKPDFHLSMKGEDAFPLYKEFIAKVKGYYGENGAEKVQEGEFGAMMQVELVNDGPVTMVLDCDLKSQTNQN
mmetsp:Transcript_10316/g.14151  ORF Transcript_10316/g.14151 Transcript_10316/m.14151 type:complete len:159 (+) Transcript_10316:56-532(+)